MPAGDVPGEWYAPTQPFPTKPPPYDRQGSSLDDLIDFTPELRAEAVELVSRYRLGPIFTPPVVSRPDGPIVTLGLGAGSGGTNWPGGGYDPETHVLYVPSRTAFYSWELIPTPDSAVSDMRYVKGTVKYGVGHGGLRDLNLRGLPLAKPPYGRLSAIDLDRANPVVWMFPGAAAGQAPAQDDERPFPGLDEQVEAQGFYGAPAVIGADAEEIVVADHNEGIVYAIQRDGSSAPSTRSHSPPGWCTGMTA